MSHSTSLLDLMAIAQAGKEYAVNALAEHERGYSGHLRAIVGPISVWSR